MALFKLISAKADFSWGELEFAKKTNIGLEEHLENWLVASPWAVAEEDLVIIGRHTTAKSDESIRYPDLLGLDKDGNLVVIELKRGRTPREVLAQLLEYAEWADSLSTKEISSIADKYLIDIHGEGSWLWDVFCETFETDEMPELNCHLRLYIAAGEIEPRIVRVCRFLRSKYGMDVSCLEYTPYKTDGGEMLVESEMKVGQEKIESKSKLNSGTPANQTKWKGNKSVRELVYEAVREFTKGDTGTSFAPKDIVPLILTKYPDFKISNVGAELVASCVNHNSHKHHNSPEEYYWLIERGKYRLLKDGDE